MARRVVFRPQAEDELQETRDWHEQRQVGLGRAFASAVDDMVGRIAENPSAISGFMSRHGGRCCGAFHTRSISASPDMTSLCWQSMDASIPLDGRRGAECGVHA